MKKTQKKQHTYRSPNLSSCVALTKRHRVWIFVDSVKIDGDTVRNRDLVSASITPTDWAAGVIDFVGNIQLG